MKRILALLIVTLMLPVTAVTADSPVFYFAEEDVTIESSLDFANITSCTSRIDALNAMLDSPQEAFALITQQELIEGLQGYTNKDLREVKLRLVQALAQSDLYLVCSKATAEEAGISDLAGLKTYLEENEYALFIMRSFEASNADYASMRLMEELCFESEIFVDETDKLESIELGPYVLAVDTSTAMEMEKDGHVVLGALTEERTEEYPDLPCAAECGLPVLRGCYYVVVAPADSKADPLMGTVNEEQLKSLFLHQPEEDISLEDDISAYVEYMTAEGLFFY